MALAATIVLEVRTDGADTNGGGYKSDGGTTDFSQQAAAQLSVTDAVTNGTTTITSVTGGFTDAMVHNLLYIQGGTGGITAGWYQILTRSDTNTITVDRSAGLTAGTGATLNVGGALGSPGGLGLVLDGHGVSGMKAYLKSGTYNLSTASLNVSGGALDLATTMSNLIFRLKGYETTREDYGAKPTISANGFAPAQIIYMGGSSSNNQYIGNVVVDGTSQAVRGFDSTAYFYNVAYRCEANHCDGGGFYKFRAVKCKTYSCDAYGFNESRPTLCWADACTTGFSLSEALTSCLASNGTSRGFDNRATILTNCVSYRNASDGFRTSTPYRGNIYVNCLSYLDGGYAFNQMVQSSLVNCAHGSATSGRTDVTPVFDIGAITLTDDPFTSGDTGDFSLNTVAGGGALLRAAGINPVGQSGAIDVGAVQHADVGGGGGSCHIIGG